MILIPVERPCVSPWISCWATVVTDAAAVASVPRWPRIKECIVMLSPHAKEDKVIPGMIFHRSRSYDLEK